MEQAVVFQGCSSQVIAALWSALLRRGYHLVRSFDLQSAIAHHPEGCGCPYHSTDLCACQYVVLLAYPASAVAAQPRVIVVHANGRMTWVTLLLDSHIASGERHALAAALAEVRAGPGTQVSAASGSPVAVPQAIDSTEGSCRSGRQL